MQTIEEAQETNRRLHRRVQRAEAPYDAMLGAAYQEVRYAQNLTKAAQQENNRLTSFIRITQEQRQREFDREESLFRTAAWFFAWAVLATGAAIYFYFY